MINASKVLTAKQMQEMDVRAINETGIPGFVLMENAGRATVEVMEDFFSLDEQVNSIAIFCGKGNNGGDGYVIARHLQARGHLVTIYSLAAIESLCGDALTNAKIAKNLQIDIIELVDDQAIDQLPFDPEMYDLVVDAIFGTGLTAAVHGHAAAAIELINDSELPLVAVDIPSGLSSDSGELFGHAIEADLTVTFAYPKLGHVLSPAANLCGFVEVVDISISAMLESEDQKTFIVDAESLDPTAFYRQKDSHKGSYGHLLAVAGGPGKSGAAAMLGSAALAVGTGLVTLGVGKDLRNTVDGLSLETMVLGLSDDDGVLKLDAFTEIDEALEGKTALAIGPGIGTEESTVAIVKKLVAQTKCPLLLDADAINAFAGKADLLKNSEVDIIITPHPGEMAKLLGITTAEVQSNRIKVATDLAVSNGIIVVLKGHRTVTALPSGEVYINLSGNPGMATAGSGDVLSGMIAGLLAQGNFSPAEAAIAAVYLHGLAGDVATDEVGEVSLIASDIIDAIPEALFLLDYAEEDE
jgi:hydroxyethylthiazole kinase-like uncharacterized protein yjeF